MSVRTTSHPAQGQQIRAPVPSCGDDPSRPFSPTARPWVPLSDSHRGLEAAGALKLTLIPVSVAAPEALDSAFAAIRQRAVGPILLGGSPFFLGHRLRIKDGAHSCSMMEMAEIARSVRQNVSIPTGIAKRVRALAKTRKTSTNRVLADLIEAGLQSKETEKERFFSIVSRLTQSKAHKSPHVRASGARLYQRWFHRTVHRRLSPGPRRCTLTAP